MSWKTDGNPKSSTDGNKVTCQPKSGDVSNAVWTPGMTTGQKKYWKITFESGAEGAFVGVTDESKLKAGWGFKGLLYGGNLSDGSGLLVGSFGPRLKNGDVVGILCDLSDPSKVKVYFDYNGSSLGLGFDVPRDTLGAEVVPAVHFSETGTASIVSSEDFPSTTRAAAKLEGFEGKWTCSEGPLAGSSTEVSLTLKKKNDNAYGGIVRVVNTIHMGIIRNESGGWTAQGGASTMMGGSEEDMQLENRTVSYFTNGSLNIDVSGDQLTINDSKWNRSETQPESVTDNPFL